MCSHHSAINIHFFFFLMIRRPPRSTLFPSRRSSDLVPNRLLRGFSRQRGVCDFTSLTALAMRPQDNDPPDLPGGSPYSAERSEEHTSELQSQSNLVCRLLLEHRTLTWSTRSAGSHTS